MRQRAQGHPRDLSCTAQGSGATLQLPTGKTVLPEKHSIAGSFGVILWRTKTPPWTD